MKDTLAVKVHKESKTIPIMDEFESENENGLKKYTTLLLNDVFCIKYCNKLFWVSLYIQRMPKKTKHISSNLTFTDLKTRLIEHVFMLTNRRDYKIVNEVFKGISKDIINNQEFECTFPVPVKFNTQNSSNRSGYGNRYCGEELVYEGTLYGETTDYMFIGAKYRRWN